MPDYFFYFHRAGSLYGSNTPLFALSLPALHSSGTIGHSQKSQSYENQTTTSTPCPITFSISIGPVLYTVATHRSSLPALHSSGTIGHSQKSQSYENQTTTPIPCPITFLFPTGILLFLKILVHTNTPHNL